MLQIDTEEHASAHIGVIPLTTTDSLGNTRTYNYDEVKGTLTSEVDEKSKTATYAYDNLDRLISVANLQMVKKLKIVIPMKMTE